jgi:hypothetical protein
MIRSYVHDLIVRVNVGLQPVASCLFKCDDHETLGKIVWRDNAQSKETHTVSSNLR